MYSDKNYIENNLSNLKRFVNSINGMLVFNDENAFISVVECLHNCINSLENNKNVIINIDEYSYVLEKFENIIGFNSLRKHIAQKINGLILIDELTNTNDPDECFFPDPILRSIVNTNFELCIGGKIISLRNVQKDYLLLKSDNNYESPLVSFVDNQRTVQQSNSKLGSNCKTTGTSDTITITDFWLTPKIGLLYTFSVRAIISSLCNVNPVFTIFFEISDSNGNIVDSYSETAADLVFSFNLYYDRTYLGFQKEGKYKICTWIEKQGTDCKSAKICCEFSIKEIKETCCRPTGKSENDIIFNNGRSKMESKLLLVNTFILPYSSISAKTKNYKLVRGKWKARRADYLNVRATGFYHRWSCSMEEKEFDTLIKAKTNRRDVMVLQYEPMAIFVKKDKVRSGHNIVDGGSASDVRLIVKC